MFVKFLKIEDKLVSSVPSAVMYRIVSNSKARGPMDGCAPRAHINIELLDARPAERGRFDLKCER
eukprot:COSAG02_NODE_2843_length_7905_cov_95.905842_4_plen_65_part_00